MLYVDPLDYDGGVDLWSLLSRTLASRPDLAARVQALDLDLGAASDPSTSPTEGQLYLQLLTHAVNVLELTLTCEFRDTRFASRLMSIEARLWLIDSRPLQFTRSQQQLVALLN